MIYRKKDEWDDFYDWFSSYLSEVCDEEEYQENIDDLHNDELNAQMIEQTLQEHNPYFVMRIVENEVCVGLISYSYLLPFWITGTAPLYGLDAFPVNRRFAPRRHFPQKKGIPFSPPQ